MTKLETIVQKIQNDQEQHVQREAEANSLQEQISLLDVKIDEAIAAGDDAVAEQLISKQTELKGKLAIAERIQNRKLDTDIYYDDLVQISKDHTAQLQPKAAKLYSELEKARHAYYEKKAQLAKILAESVLNRVECARWAGIKAEETHWDDFQCVQLKPWALDVPFYERDIILQIDPKYFDNFGWVINYGVSEPQQ